MHRNRYWLALLICVSAVVIAYSTMTLYRLYCYWRLDSRTNLLAIDWHVEEVEEDLFAAAGTYSFHVGDKVIEGKGYVLPVYNNRWAAEAMLSRNAEEYQAIWYRLKDPSISSLQKTFPLKECVYTAILIALVLYFIWLGKYVKQFTKNNYAKESQC